ncbi:DEAD/DEAH box helicase family protein [Streptomyces sp. NPDC051940]|uniref:DEAD/DEAH box helicase family protein n=1 Tax=Streptomyces sp. NPDC051940 TaxID=3155675 RepID=UPI003422D75F
MTTDVTTLELRRHQREALLRLEECWAAGRRRAWVVLPPGTGKTLTGLEAARRLGRPVVVFGPNTAIQGQWIREWARLSDTPAGTDRALGHRVTVLTYQALASFDPDAEVDEDGAEAGTHLARLRTGGRELVAALRGLGPFTLLLDECHHLLDTWGELVAELLRELPDATVIGLTATPPDRLTAAEAELVAELFGPAVHGPSIPAVVREGQLAPFAELVWLTEPTAHESQWLAAEAERFAELTTDLLDPGFAETPFLGWLDERIVARRRAGDPDAAAVPWHRFEREHPGLAGAALRFHHAGLLALPEGARLREEHRHRPSAEDWVCLLDDYIRRCLRPAGQTAAVEAVRTALPAVGHTLTARGIRGGRSPVDRVLARSAAKTRAVREILAAESDALGERLRAVVLCDHERATATLPARLTGVLDEEAGSARLVLGELAADGRTAPLAPMLVTGRTVAAGPETARLFAEFCAGEGREVRLVEAGGGLVEVAGDSGWHSRRWVPLVTRFFESGGCRVLVGTRGMLGEGWDARGVNALVDLTEATTATAVVQTRGRALRTDPGWPEKVADNWSVVCVAPGHPKGSADWERFVRKHEGYFGVTDAGLVMAGVAHVHPGLSPYAPPGEEEFDGLNALMLQRAGERDRVRGLWRVGEPYEDRLVHTVRVTPGRRWQSRTAPPAAEHRPPAVLPRRRGVTPLREPDRRAARWWARGLAIPVGVLGALVGGAGFTALAGDGPAAFLVALVCCAGPYEAVRRRLDAWRWRRMRAATGAGLLAEAARDADLPALACALADGLRDAGLSPCGAEAVEVEPDGTGAYRIHLRGVPPVVSARFATAFDELISPLAVPRYLIPRYVVTASGREAGLALYDPAPPANAVVYHAIPSVLGENRKRVVAFARAWARWVSVADPLFTRSPEGAGVLAAQAGASPLDATTSMRAAWA